MNKKPRNGLFGGTAMYVVLFVLLVTGFAYYLRDSGGSTTQELQTSQFISQLKQNDIKSFEIQPSGGVYKVSGEYRKEQKVTGDSCLKHQLFEPSTSQDQEVLRLHSS
jgi:cell division protease FtsH